MVLSSRQVIKGEVYYVNHIRPAPPVKALVNIDFQVVMDSVDCDPGYSFVGVEKESYIVGTGTEVAKTVVGLESSSCGDSCISGKGKLIQTGG